jgi:peptide/nickel transport system substrate-binding protein
MRRIILFAALITLICWKPAAAEGQFRIAHDLGSGGAETMDPYDGNRFWPTINLVFNRLVALDENLQPEAVLATSWQASDDLTVWTIGLREGVSFHDGSAFDADDAVYSLNRMIDPEFDSPLLATLGIISEVRAVDPLTVEIRLSQPEADLPLLLTDYRVLMTPAGSGESIAEKPVGTGPFVAETIAPEGTTSLRANPNYFRGHPGVERVEIVAIPDNAAQVQALLSGQIDYLDRIDGKQLALFADNPAFTVQHIDTGNWNGLVMRTDTAPYDDPRVRKALRIAVDRDALIDLVLGKDGGTPACDTPVWTGDPYRWEGRCDRDVEGAKRLLSDAGFPDGIDIDIHTSDLEEHFVSLVEAYQDQVKDAGIRVKLVMATSDGYWDDVWMKEPFVVTSWDQRPAPQILNEAFRSGASWNETYWADADFDNTLDKARGEGDFARRKELYERAQTKLFEEGGALIPYHKKVVRVFASSVRNVDPIMVDSLRWDRITVE